MQIFVSIGTPNKCFISQLLFPQKVWWIDSHPDQRYWIKHSFFKLIEKVLKRNVHFLAKIHNFLTPLYFTSSSWCFFFFSRKIFYKETTYYTLTGIIIQDKLKRTVQDKMCTLGNQLGSGTSQGLTANNRNSFQQNCKYLTWTFTVTPK